MVELTVLVGIVLRAGLGGGGPPAVGGLLWRAGNPHPLGSRTPLSAKGGSEFVRATEGNHTTNFRGGNRNDVCCCLQGYLAHKKPPPPLGPPEGPRHEPTAGSQGGAVVCERGTPVAGGWFYADRGEVSGVEGQRLRVEGLGLRA